MELPYFAVTASTSSCVKKRWLKSSISRYVCRNFVETSSLSFCRVKWPSSSRRPTDIATVSRELAGAGGAASMAVKRIVQKASDRRKDDLIGKKRFKTFAEFELQRKTRET